MGRTRVDAYDESQGYKVCGNEIYTMQHLERKKNALLREALEAMTNLAPRVKDYGGCFGRMAGGYGGKECACTACKIRREIEPANSR